MLTVLKWVLGVASVLLALNSLGSLHKGVYQFAGYGIAAAVCAGAAAAIGGWQRQQAE